MHTSIIIHWHVAHLNDKQSTSLCELIILIHHDVRVVCYFAECEPTASSFLNISADTGTLFPETSIITLQPITI